MHPRFYAAQTGTDPLASPAEVLAHFRAEGKAAGARVTALFQPAFYCAAAAAAAVPVEGDPFEHWLAVGVERRIVPTPLYDDAHYRAHHPELRDDRWAFVDYATDGCYRLDRRPTAYVQSYGARVPERARERQDPVLLTGMLHRAGEFDLRTTSWLEEGIAAVAAKVERLASGPVADLVARAVAIEPAIGEAPLAMRTASWPPHLHWDSLTVAAAEDLRRSLPVGQADAVVFLPDDGSAAGVDLPGLVLEVACTDAAASAAPHAVDLRPFLDRLGPRQRVQVVLDLVRGVRPGRVVVLENVLGTRMLARYGRPLANTMTVAGRVDGEKVGLAGFVEAQRRRDEGA
ncbi:hypothetical protein GCM10028801_33490 [Nocardioides maradonensis]